MSGEGGHCNEVLTIDFHPEDENKFVSGGMDRSVKIWSIAEMHALIHQSVEWQVSGISFPTVQMQFPTFSSTKVHCNYVDCLRWGGDYVLSKSVDNVIYMWKPDQDPSKADRGYVQLVNEFHLQDAKAWFIRFSLDFNCRLLACGNVAGRVYCWDPHSFMMPAVAKVKRPTGPKGQITAGMIVRQTALSYDGSILLFCCDDGTIWRFDKQKEEGGDDGDDDDDNDDDNDDDDGQAGE